MNRSGAKKSPEPFSWSAFDLLDGLSFGWGAVGHL